MWNNPHMLVLDEPTNYLDREALGGLAVAIREWSGAVVMISHHTEFVSALCPELWHVDNGVLTAQGQSAVHDEHFESSAAKISKMTSKPKKKKMTKNEVKAQDLRRRNRYLAWIENGGQFSKIPREPDTDEEVDDE
jgi:elongation factor 3